jgi:osmotically-inducible protein OsmY
MKAAIGILTCALTLTCAVPQPAHAARAAAVEQSADQTLSTAIAGRFAKDAALKNYDIKVSVTAGVATLTGTVKTDMHKARAAELAEAAGAKSVDNRLTVNAAAAAKGTSGTIKDDARDAADKAEDVAERAWKETKDGWEVVVDKTADMAKKAGAEITDAWITTNIKARMLDEDTLDGSNIDVDTDRRVVTLSGTVTSEAGRKTAVDIVKRTDGVERIVDRLTMAPKK